MTRYDDRDQFHVFDLLFGLMLGLVAGGLAGLLFAPKPGKDLQDDVQDFVKRLPNQLDQGLSKSKVQYQALVGKTREGIETQLEQRSFRKQASRMEDAKRREALEIGYDYQ